MFLGITVDKSDVFESKLHAGIDFFFDEDGTLSRHCGAAPLEDVRLGTQYRTTWTIVDPSFHVAAYFVTDEDGEARDAVFEILSSLLASAPLASYDRPAPVLILPRLFDHDLCDNLIALHENGQPHDSGFMRKNQEIFDHSFKRRRDFFVTDEAVRELINTRMSQCVIPEIRKLFFTEITRMERYLVARYAAEENGHFKPHRDNSQRITGHRRFAVSVALNEDFEGGELRFPEYSDRRHKVRKGWAVVFPCAILHTVDRVEHGHRYAFLPFLYDESGAKIKSDC